MAGQRGFCGKNQRDDDFSFSKAGAEAIIECCICMERKSSIILPCSHTYCEKCIDSWEEAEGVEFGTMPGLMYDG